MGFVITSDEASELARRRTRALEDFTQFAASLTDADKAALRRAVDDLYDDQGLPR